MRSRQVTWRLPVTLALLLACAASALAGPIGEAAAQGRWTPVGSLETGRREHTATLLASGQVLVAGGFNFPNHVPTVLSSAELYDPATGKWTPTAPLNAARMQHTATLLLSGQVLVAGGFNSPENPNELSSAELYDPATGKWTPTGALSTARSSHTATLLRSGQVLVVGGGSASAELYDPATGKWTRAGALNTDRDSYTATLLPSGQVLVAGGSDGDPLSSAELYDPASGLWTPTGALGRGRELHTATLLPSGQVLVAGGFGSSGFVRNENLQSAELYDPATGRWTSTGDLGTARSDHTATLLPSGQVVIAGGSPNCCPQGHLASELYDPATGKWTSTGPLGTDRNLHTATLLPSGRVLVVGGADSVSTVTNSVELFEAATGRWTPTGALGNGRQSHTATLLLSGHVLVSGGELDFFSAESYDAATGRWTPTGALGTGRSEHTATLLPSGQVLVAGGLGVDTSVLTSAELYAPATGRWTPTGDLGTARSDHTATLLPSGQVLVAGGFGKPATLTSAELYDLATGRWTSTGALGTGRELHTATLLPSGQVLVAGGQDANNSLGSAELYDPATGRWSSTGALGTGRALHTATLLPSGQVLVAGGGDRGNFLSSAELYDPATRRWTPTGSLSAGRDNHTATLLPSGQVLVAGGRDGDNSLSSAELYDPATGRWSPTGALATGRALHTVTLLPPGQVLVAGGVNEIGQSTIAEIYEPGLGFQAAWRPNLDSVSPAAVGSALGVEGSLFRGFSEASGGGTQQSATNYPLVQLRRLDNEQTRFLLSDPSEPWTDGTFTSVPLSAFPPGPALVTVFTNGIPSVAKSIVVQAEKTLGAPAPEPLRLGPLHVRPHQVARGDPVEVMTILRAGGTAVPRLTVFLYDGDPEAGGQVLRIKRGGSLGAHETREVRIPFRPTRCGTYQLVVIAGQGTPFEAERTARPLHVDCELPDGR